MKKPLAAVLVVGAMLLGVCVAVPAGVLAYWNLVLPAEADAERDARLAPIADAYAAGRTPSAAEIDRFAADRTTRADLLDLLAEHDATDLVAARWRSEEARAEADMVRWLHFPTELNGWPDDIELAGRATIGDARWYVWRFRVQPPHWAAERGWMVGVSGPWPATTGTWSELDPYSEDAARTLVQRRHAYLNDGAKPDVQLELIAR